MIMNAIVAIALGLTPAQPGNALQTFNYNQGEYAAVIGRFRESRDRQGTTHLRGFNRYTGKAFDLAVRDDGRVEGTVGEAYMVFKVDDAG